MNNFQVRNASFRTNASLRSWTSSSLFLKRKNHCFLLVKKLLVRVKPLYTGGIKIFNTNTVEYGRNKISNNPCLAIGTMVNSASGNRRR